MLSRQEIDGLVAEAARSSLLGARVIRAESTPSSDSEGRDALKVVVVLGDEPDRERVAVSALAAMVAIGRALSGHGEARSPIVEFVTEKELAEDGDTDA